MRVFSGRKIGAAALIVISAVALTACQGRNASLEGVDTMATASTGSASIKDAAEAGKRWQADPGNVSLGLAYANRLKALGEIDRQLEVLRTLSQSNAGDARLLVIYGKELAQAGKANEAAGVLEQAIRSGKADWKVYSALGSAYDQADRHSDARAQYERALQMQPNEISVLNNMGMSYALEGNLAKAEEILRGAYALPAGQKNSRLRQNLALVVGLAGRYDEARRIASQDLPPSEIEANMAYLQKMMSQPNTWQKLQDGTEG
jgi:Flp pilus assembly protein TadD